MLLSRQREEKDLANQRELTLMLEAVICIAVVIASVEGAANRKYQNAVLLVWLAYFCYSLYMILNNS
jgi:hypothetical protein